MRSGRLDSSTASIGSEQIAALRAFLRTRCGSLQGAFRSLDVHGDGQLTSFDFAQGLKRLGYTGDTTAVFQTLADSSGLLTQRAFVGLIGCEGTTPPASPKRDGASSALSTASSVHVSDSNHRRTSGCVSDSSVGEVGAELQQPARSEAATTAKFGSGEGCSESESSASSVRNGAGPMVALARAAADGKILNRTRSPKRYLASQWQDAASGTARQPLAQSRAGSTESLRSVALQPAAPDDARTRIELYVRLGRLEEQLAAEQQLRLEAQSRLVRLEEQRLGPHIADDGELESLVRRELQRRVAEMQPRLEEMAQQVFQNRVDALENRMRGLEKSSQFVERAVLELNADLERTIVARAVAEAKTEACAMFGEKLNTIQAHAQNVVVGAETKDGFAKQLQVDLRELKQKYNELAARLPDCEARRQAEADAVQAKLQTLICKIDDTRVDASAGNKWSVDVSSGLQPNVRERGANIHRSVSAESATSICRRVQLSPEVEKREIGMQRCDPTPKVVHSSTAPRPTAIVGPSAIGTSSGTGTTQSPLGSRVDSSRTLQMLREENLRLREKNVEMRENAAAGPHISRGLQRAIPVADDPPRLLGRTPQHGALKSQASASGRTSVGRQQSSDPAFVTQVIGGKSPASGR